MTKFSEFTFKNLIDQLATLGLSVEGYRTVHLNHLGLVIYPDADFVIDDCFSLIDDVLNQNDLKVVGIYQNTEDDGYYFECIRVMPIYCN